jgi:hypothetical protein
MSRLCSSAFLVLVAGAAQAAPVAVHVAPGIGLDDAERTELAARLGEVLTSLSHTAVAVATLDEGCASQPACGAAAVAAAGAEALVIVEVLKVGDEGEVTETVVDKEGRALSTSTQSVSGSFAGFNPTEQTIAALKPLMTVIAPPPAPPAPQAQGDGRLGLGLAVRADVAMQHGRSFGVTADIPAVDNALSGDGIKGFGGGLLLQLSWHLPIDGHWLNRAFGVELDAGYTLTGANGSIPFSQYETQNGGTKLVTTTYDYEGLIHVVPLSLGLRSRLPLQDLGLPVHVDVSAGGNALWGLSVSSASVQGEDVAFAVDNSASDFAFGFYAEGGVALDLGPGELTGAYRYVSSYLDFEHGAFNPSPGDLGGHHLLVGYRFTL